MKSKKAVPSGNNAPSPLILSLIGSFLTENGLELTTKSLSQEVKAKRKSQGWPATANGVKMPDISLEQLLKRWQEDQDETKQEQSSESSASESSAENDSEDESSADDAAVTKKTKSASAPRRASASSSSSLTSSSSSSSSSSDSDADDEYEKPVRTKGQRPVRKTATESTAPKKSLKRKAEPSPTPSPSNSSSSESEDASSSSEDERPVKKTKIEQVLGNGITNDMSSSSASDDSDEESGASDDESAADVALPESESSSGSSDDSDDSSAAEEDPVLLKDQDKNGAPFVKASSDSSGTIVGDKQTFSESASTSSDTSSDESIPEAKPTKALAGPKRHIGAKPTPLAELSARATEDSHISNAYRSYDYAERAYNDLSVTRGKGFTKEKNKKKRGSYRGGAIDISGGKAFKFED